jgi:RISC-loading complex subunit TARBP2
MFTAMGTGRSKKEAKHAAAKAVLDKLIVNSQGDSSLGTNSVAV